MTITQAELLLDGAPMKGIQTDRWDPSALAGKLNRGDEKSRIKQDLNDPRYGTLLVASL